LKAGSWTAPGSNDQDEGKDEGKNPLENELEDPITRMSTSSAATLGRPIVRAESKSNKYERIESFWSILFIVDVCEDGGIVLAAITKLAAKCLIQARHRVKSSFQTVPLWGNSSHDFIRRRGLDMNSKEFPGKRIMSRAGR
jgi:hypothetical protein